MTARQERSGCAEHEHLAARGRQQMRERHAVIRHRPSMTSKDRGAVIDRGQPRQTHLLRQAHQLFAEIGKQIPAEFLHIAGWRQRCTHRGGAAQDNGRLAMKRATGSPLKKNAPSMPTFAEVAHLIAGPNAPPWLAAHFERWTPGLMVDRFVHEMQPTKAAMKERLAEVRDAASMLQHALRHTPTRAFLEIAPSDPIEYGVAFEHMLQELVGRAEHAMTSPALSTEDGKTRPGRGKAMAASTFSPKLFCAVLVAEAWTYLRRRSPGPRNPKVAAAANTLWRVSGGETTHRGEEPLNGWRYYFKEVQAPALGKVREECRRHLEEAERLSAILSGK